MRMASLRRDDSASSTMTMDLLQRAKTSIDQLQGDLTQASARITSLESDLLETRGAHNSALQREAVLVAAITGLQAEIRQAEERTREERDRRADDVSNLRRENESLAASLTAAKRGEERTRERAEDLERRLRAATEDGREDKTAVHRLDSERAALLQRVQDVERKLAAAQEQVRRLEGQENGQEELTFWHQAAKQKEELAVSQRDELQGLRSKILSLERKLADRSTEADSQAAELVLANSKVAELTALYSASVEDADALAEQVENVSQSKHSFEHQTLQLVVSWLRIVRSRFAGLLPPVDATTGTRTPESDVLHELIGRIASNNGSFDLPALVSQVAAHLDTLPSVRGWFEHALGAFEGLVLERMRRMVLVMEDLIKRLNDSEGHLKRVETTTGVALADRTRQLSELKRQLATATASLQEHGKDGEALRHTVEKLTDINNQLEDRVESVTKEFEAVRQELDIAREAVEVSHEERYALANTVATLEERLSQHQSQSEAKNAKLREFLSRLEQQLVDQEHAYKNKATGYAQEARDLREKLAEAVNYEVPHRLSNWLHSMHTRAETLQDAHARLLKDSSAQLLRLNGYLSGSGGSPTAPPWLPDVSSQLSHMFAKSNDIAQQLQHLSGQLKDVTSGLLGEAAENFRRSMNITLPSNGAAAVSKPSSVSFFDRTFDSTPSSIPAASLPVREPAGLDVSGSSGSILDDIRMLLPQAQQQQQQHRSSQHNIPADTRVHSGHATAAPLGDSHLGGKLDARDLAEAIVGLLNQSSPLRAATSRSVSRGREGTPSAGTSSVAADLRSSGVAGLLDRSRRSSITSAGSEAGLYGLPRASAINRSTSMSSKEPDRERNTSRVMSERRGDRDVEGYAVRHYLEKSRISNTPVRNLSSSIRR